MTPVIKFVRPLSAFGLAALAVLSSCEKIDDGAATRAQGWDGTLSTVIEPGPREVFTDIDETMPAASPCEKTAADAHEILKKNCSLCHDIGAASSGVAPVFDFVLNDDRLKTEIWKRMGQPALRFVIPGDPDNSVIYERAAIARDMPPIQGDVTAPFYPRVTYSESSVLREWILNCFEGGAVAAPSTGSAGGG